MCSYNIEFVVPELAMVLYDLLYAVLEHWINELLLFLAGEVLNQFYFSLNCHNKQITADVNFFPYVTHFTWELTVGFESFFILSSSLRYYFFCMGPIGVFSAPTPKCLISLEPKWSSLFLFC